MQKAFSSVVESDVAYSEVCEFVHDFPEECWVHVTFGSFAPETHFASEIAEVCKFDKRLFQRGRLRIEGYLAASLSVIMYTNALGPWRWIFR